LTVGNYSREVSPRIVGRCFLVPLCRLTNLPITFCSLAKWRI